MTIEFSAITRMSMLAVLVACAASCGGDDTQCGPGTEDRDGQCVVSIRGHDAGDDSTDLGSSTNDADEDADGGLNNRIRVSDLQSERADADLMSVGTFDAAPFAISSQFIVLRECPGAVGSACTMKWIAEDGSIGVERTVSSDMLIPAPENEPHVATFLGEPTGRCDDPFGGYAVHRGRPALVRLADGAESWTGASGYYVSRPQTEYLFRSSFYSAGAPFSEVPQECPETEIQPELRWLQPPHDPVPQTVDGMPVRGALEPGVFLLAPLDSATAPEWVIANGPDRFVCGTGPAHEIRWELPSSTKNWANLILTDSPDTRRYCRISDGRVVDVSATGRQQLRGDTVLSCDEIQDVDPRFECRWNHLATDANGELTSESEPELSANGRVLWYVDQDGNIAFVEPGVNAVPTVLQAAVEPGSSLFDAGDQRLLVHTGNGVWTLHTDGLASFIDDVDHVSRISGPGPRPFIMTREENLRTRLGVLDHATMRLTWLSQNAAYSSSDDLGDCTRPWVTRSFESGLPEMSYESQILYFAEYIGENEVDLVAYDLASRGDPIRLGSGEPENCRAPLADDASIAGAWRTSAGTYEVYRATLAR